MEVKYRKLKFPHKRNTVLAIMPWWAKYFGVYGWSWFYKEIWGPWASMQYCMLCHFMIVFNNKRDHPTDTQGAGALRYTKERPWASLNVIPFIYICCETLPYNAISKQSHLQEYEGCWGKARHSQIWLKSGQWSLKRSQKSKFMGFMVLTIKLNRSFHRMFSWWDECKAL